MDHKQSATPSGRRAGAFYPNWNSCLIIERPQKARFKKRLPFAPDARAGAFPAKLAEITCPRHLYFANWFRVRASSGDNDFRSPVSPARIGLSNVFVVLSR